ncbi:hypothetical protein ABNN70_06475 [Sporolactobacillus sp. Y61]|uniref:CRISPR-associated protein Csh1 n=1 Tax=Sporolactobacillus sp. Y61 TaxID=3160863 RepID=A0AAU8IIL7_9BACL
MIMDFTKMYQEAVKKNQSILFDTYKLKRGIYILLDYHKTWEQNLDSIENSYVIIDRTETYVNKSLQEKFKKLDYYSSVLFDSSNKMVDLPGRKIHSITPLAFFMKEQTFLLDKKKEDMSAAEQKKVLFPDELKKHIEEFYQKLEQFDDGFLNLYPITAHKKKDKQQQLKERDQFFTENYPDLVSALKDPVRLNRNHDIRKYLIENMDQIILWLKAIKERTNFSNYVKIFFDVPVEDYQQEYKLYVVQKIYTVNDYCAIDGSNIVGLPSGDMTVNGKKPYLKHRTMRTEVPLRLSVDEAIARKDLYKWLESHGKFITQKYSYQELLKQDLRSEEGMYYLSLDTDSSVIYLDNVPFNARQRKVRVPFREIQYNKELKTYQETDKEIYDRAELFGWVNRFFFKNQLQGSWLTGEISVNQVITPTLQSIILQSRQAWFDFLFKGSASAIRPMINRLTLELITELIVTSERGGRTQILQAYYLRLGLLDCLDVKIDEMKGEDIMDYLSELYHNTDHDLDNNNFFAIENDRQFYYLAGQLTYYLAAQSEAANMTHDLYRPVMMAVGNPEKLKEQLEEMRKIYGYRLRHNYQRFNYAYAAVMGYSPDEKTTQLDKELMLAGLLSANLFFKKKTKNDEKEIDV